MGIKIGHRHIHTILPIRLQKLLGIQEKRGRTGKTTKVVQLKVFTLSKITNFAKKEHFLKGSIDENLIILDQFINTKIGKGSY